MSQSAHSEPEPASGTYSDQSASPAQPRRDHIRNKILHQHIQKALRQPPSSKTFPRSLALNIITQRSSSALQNQDEGEHIPGGLSRDELTSMAPVTLPRIEDELKHTLLAIFDYFAADEAEAETDEENRLQSATRIPDEVRRRQDALTQKRARLTECRAQVLRLVEQINESHPALEAELATALETLPAQLRATRAAHADVLAATVEAALLKLSLIRARTHRAVYGLAIPPSSGSSSSNLAASRAAGSQKTRTVADAVAATHEALLARQRAQAEEMRALDGQLEAYEGMLRMVDGRREGAFAQVVKDMARVKRETDECRKDLLRLGWTGD
ncbi:hypothetical protein C8Q79DRAFT_929482 [Trametes meyenii]|nr:hypothetical protein C8Q79DRAFT_929482 [Trametes meyenii]